MSELFGVIPTRFDRFWEQLREWPLFCLRSFRDKLAEELVAYSQGCVAPEEFADELEELLRNPHVAAWQILELRESLEGDERAEFLARRLALTCREIGERERTEYHKLVPQWRQSTLA